MRGTTGAFLDGYYIVNRPNSRQFNISNLLDGTTWSGLDYAYKEGWPDNLVAVYVHNGILYLFGTETTEAHRNTGNPSFPIERIDGGVIRVGLAGAWTPVSIMGRLYFLGATRDGKVAAYRLDGGTATAVSTQTVDESLAAWNIKYTTAYSYFDRGHWFWVLNINTGNSEPHTWVLDVTESDKLGAPQWHKRARWDAGASRYVGYRPWFHTFIPDWNTVGQHIVGDVATGNLYDMSSDFYDEAGADIRAQRTMAVIYNEGKRVYHHRVDIENEAGLVSGAGNAPVVTLDWSDDRGHTFGTGAGGAGASVTLSTGAAAAYSARAYAVALGSSRWRNYRLAIKGQSKIAIIDASLEASMGVV
jgi:hypothetical protein